MKAKARKKSYPKISSLITGAIKHKQELNGENLSITEIVRELAKAGVSPAAFRNYRKGLRAVPAAKANVIATYFFDGGIDAARKFVNDLKEAEKEGLAAHRSAADRLADGRPLRIDVTDYPPFSKAISEFVDHLCRLSALTQETPVHGQDFDMRQALWHNEVDLAAGYFANLYRAVQVHFWPTTIKIGLGAVILKQHEKSKKLIEEVLAGYRIESRSLLRPVLVEREVGAIHCLQTLQYAENEVTFVKKMTAETLRAEGFAEALKQAQNEFKREIAVAVVDEYTSFQILAALKGDGIPVLPLSSRKAARETPRRELPASFLSIGCSRKQSELRDVMEQALYLFLATEVESNALKFASLHKQLLSEVNDIVTRYYPDYRYEGSDPELKRKAAANAFRAAYGWVLYVLGLDHQSIENIPRRGLPWGPILKRTREQVLSALANEKDAIRSQIDLVAGTGDAPPSEERFKMLCESLDLRIQLLGVQREYVLEDRNILVRTVQDGLRGQPVGLPIERGKEGGRIEVLHPADESIKEKMRVLNGFLRDLQDFYAKRVGDDAVQAAAANEESGVLPKLRRFRHQIQEHYIKPGAIGTSAPAAEDIVQRQGAEQDSASCPIFGKSQDDRVLLASFGKSPTRYLGSACLRPYPRRGHPGWLELFYLWIRPDYRRLAVGDQLIHEAMRYVEGTKYTHLVVEVLQTLNEGVTYFRKRGFQPHTTEDGRLILRLEIPKRVNHNRVLS